ncbi:hypothetical protein [Pseudoalteromonas ruthenica]|uniref:hypothetical protein n=1 Tax=Pseudoalteromonas ruthenica TaxID=151081 RepID=UPI00110B0E20|nr:hypothetical protein [Pseudoalteromonas ruthenica]TMO87685.1 hypothetical protein CWC12_10425 [Pseudoalteromonas ruthenica]TMP20856.1 hypothetical protein CWC06_19545 [Pseudoalteromonas ruthenica]
MKWYYGYMQKPDGRVCLSQPFECPDKAKKERDALRAPDIKVTTRILAENDDDALEQAKQTLG